MAGTIITYGLTVKLLRDRMERQSTGWPAWKIKAWLARTDYAWICSAPSCKYRAGRHVPDRRCRQAGRGEARWRASRCDRGGVTVFRKNNSPEQTLAEAKAHAIRTLANAAQLLDLLGSDQAVEEALSDASRDLP